MNDLLAEEWFTLESIDEVESDDRLYCIAVDSPDKQFLIGELGVPTHNTDEGKAEDELKGEASMIIGSIARLGRAAGVHLVIATQRPDATLIPGETKANLGVRINCGRTDSNASSMILGNAEGTRVKANPKGRLYLGIYGSGNHGQGMFADPNWIDEYLASQGKNPDGTPISQPRSKLAKLENFEDFADGDLDAREGIDNEGAIEKIREKEEAGFYGTDDDDDDIIDEQKLDDEVAELMAEFGGEETEEETKLGRPDLTGGSKDENKFHRPEEDWDEDLESLIEENFE